MGRRLRCVKRGDEIGTAREHRALVDRSLVRHLAGIERRRLAQQDRPADAVRAAGRSRRESNEQRVESLECETREAEVVVRIRSASDVDLEEWAGETVADLFREVYSRRLVVTKARR